MTFRLWRCLFHESIIEVWNINRKKHKMTCPHLWNQTSALLDHPGPAVWIELNFAFLKGSQYGRIIPETSRISQPESLCWDLQCLAGRECRRSPREGCRNIGGTSSPRLACPVKGKLWPHIGMKVHKWCWKKWKWSSLPTSTSVHYILSDVVVNPHPPSRVELRHAFSQRLEKFCIPWLF